MHRDEALVRARALDARVNAVALPATTRDLDRLIRTALWKASDERAIVNAPQEVFRLLKSKKDAKAIVIDGGTEAEPFVRTSDAAEFNFGVTLTIDEGGGVTLLAYRFHLKYRQGCSPPYVRMDLNPTTHEDALREPRAHVHAGADDVRIPTPLMHPMELLDLVIYGGPADCPPAV